MVIQHVGWTILFTLSIASTIFVIVMSVFLVIRKGVEIRSEHLRKRLYTHYSSTFSVLLLQEYPDDLFGMRASERFRRYESSIVDMKKELEAKSQRNLNFHMKVIRSVLVDFSKDLKGETADRIIYYIYSLKILDGLFKKMESPHWWIRAEAAQELGVLHAKRAIAPLTAALEDVHPDVRFQAMQSLLMVIGVSALQSILRITKRLSQWTAIELSVIILQYREEAVPYLLEALYAPDPSVVLLSIVLLAEIGFVDAVEPLLQLYRTTNAPLMQAAILEALGRLGDERALTLLLEASQSQETTVRIKALEALGRLGAKKSWGFLSTRLRAGEIIEKRVAALALSRLGKDGLNALSEIIKTSDKTTSSIALEVFEGTEQIEG
jgi:HEAT repeat protein